LAEKPNKDYTPERIAKTTRPYVNIAWEYQEAFLVQLARCGSIMIASRESGVSYQAIRRQREKDELFEAMVQEAQEAFNAHLTEKLYERAVEGVITTEEKNANGDVVKQTRRFSDQLFMMMLKRRMPEYRETAQVDHNISGGIVFLGLTADDSKDWLDKHGDSKIE